MREMIGLIEIRQRGQKTSQKIRFFGFLNTMSSKSDGQVGVKDNKVSKDVKWHPHGMGVRVMIRNEDGRVAGVMALRLHGSNRFLNVVQAIN